MITSDQQTKLNQLQQTINTFEQKGTRIDIELDQKTKERDELIKQLNEKGINSPSEIENAKKNIANDIEKLINEANDIINKIPAGIRDELGFTKD